MTADALVLAFPGQGSLGVGVGAPWREHPSFEVVDAISATTSTDVAALLLNADQETLVSTENAQLATFALSLCILEATALAGRATLALGHSLGEYTALVGAGIVAQAQGATLVAVRGNAMRAAAEKEPGGLVAVLGGDRSTAAAACAAIDGLWIANVNGPGQVVLGGGTEAITALQDRVKELGFRRAIPLRVGGAFHTPLMASASLALGPALAATTFAQGSASVVANVDGVVHEDAADWPGLLLRQLTEPVEFDGCVRALPAGARVVECGPGGVLQGLIGRIRDDLDVLTVGVPEDLKQLDGAT